MIISCEESTEKDEPAKETRAGKEKLAGVRLKRMVSEVLVAPSMA